MEKYDLAGKVIGMPMRIHNALGAGFVECLILNILSILSKVLP
jgi:hypothetical protein